MYIQNLLNFREMKKENCLYEYWISRTSIESKISKPLGTRREIDINPLLITHKKNV